MLYESAVAKKLHYFFFHLVSYGIAERGRDAIKLLCKEREREGKTIAESFFFLINTRAGYAIIIVGGI